MVLKLPARASLIRETDVLAKSGVPVVTFVTDLPVESTAYIGVDNGAAGRTAAHLVQSMNMPKGG